MTEEQKTSTELPEVEVVAQSVKASSLLKKIQSSIKDYRSKDSNPKLYGETERELGSPSKTDRAFETAREQNPGKNVFDVPNWGIKDYINERNAFQKQLSTIAGDPAWFYFKIFFKFDTSYGLFGGILGQTPTDHFPINCAVGYLGNIANRYTQEGINDRREALIAFVQTLSYISSNSPWFFSSIKDVNNAYVNRLDKAYEQRKLTLEFNEDAVDMRVTSLFDMYRMACFDFAHQKEIIPENLRKFDMDVILFETPLRIYQTAAIDSKNRTAPYKTLYGNQAVDRMSFKLFSFQNCEFEMESLNDIYPSQFSNATPFQIKPTVKIKYDKCYFHNSNEWARLLFGDSGWLWDDRGKGQSDTRTLMQQHALDNKYYYSQYSKVYKPIVEASEAVVSDALRMVHPSVVLGNLYKQTNLKDTVVNTAFSQVVKQPFGGNPFNKHYWQKKGNELLNNAKDKIGI